VQGGWNLTGDAYLVDADGQFVYQARTDDMIISAGYNIAGPEVEDALLQHPAVAECGVIGVPDDERGQIVKAFVVLKPGHEGGEAMVRALQEHVKQAIAPYKYPRAVEFRTQLPRPDRQAAARPARQPDDDPDEHLHHAHRPLSPATLPGSSSIRGISTSSTRRRRTGSRMRSTGRSRR
jgi:hypothetical protein